MTESRNYHNGAGFCSRCNTFGSQVFTGEQLGQHCKVCAVGTTYHWGRNETTGEQEFLCEEHYAKNKPAQHDTIESLLCQLFDNLDREN